MTSHPVCHKIHLRDSGCGIIRHRNPSGGQVGKSESTVMATGTETGPNSQSTVHPASATVGGTTPLIPQAVCELELTAAMHSTWANSALLQKMTSMPRYPTKASSMIFARRLLALVSVLIRQATAISRLYFLSQGG